MVHVALEVVFGVDGELLAAAVSRLDLLVGGLLSRDLHCGDFLVEEQLGGDTLVAAVVLRVNSVTGDLDLEVNMMVVDR